jgi:RsiW-degrading membrane proteinase PrsW (M82 family)
MSTLILMLVASIPPLALASYIYNLNKSVEKNAILSLKLLVLGALVATPIAAIIEPATAELFYGDGLLIQMLLGVALVEEGAKFFVIKKFVFSKQKFKAPIDGIVYAVMVGLGFALAENMLYVFTWGFNAGIIRMLTAIPMHAMYGVILGYYVGKAQLDFSNQKKYFSQGLFFAVALHGTYNFIAGISAGALPVFLILGIAYYVTNSMIAKGQYRVLIERLNSPTENQKK